MNTKELACLTKCRKLQRLAVHYSRNMTDDIVDLLRALPQLQTLDLK